MEDFEVESDLFVWACQQRHCYLSDLDIVEVQPVGPHSEFSLIDSQS